MDQSSVANVCKYKFGLCRVFCESGIHREPAGTDIISFRKEILLQESNVRLLETSSEHDDVGIKL